MFIAVVVEILCITIVSKKVYIEVTVERVFNIVERVCIKVTFERTCRLCT